MDKADFVKCFEIEIFGEPASKANSRRLVRRGKNIISIKSEKAMGYVDMFAKQCPVLPELIMGDLWIDFTIWYASRRPDLDESLILDCMQKRLINNDRQVVARTSIKMLDKDNPRTKIAIFKLP